MIVQIISLNTERINKVVQLAIEQGSADFVGKLFEKGSGFAHLLLLLFLTLLCLIHFCI